MKQKLSMNAPVNQIGQSMCPGGRVEKKTIWDRIAELIEVLEMGIGFALYLALFAGIIVGLYMGTRLACLLLRVFHQTLEVLD